MTQVEDKVKTEAYPSVSLCPQNGLARSEGTDNPVAGGTGEGRKVGEGEQGACPAQQGPRGRAKVRGCTSRDAGAWNSLDWSGALCAGQGGARDPEQEQKMDHGRAAMPSQGAGSFSSRGPSWVIEQLPGRGRGVHGIVS